MILEVNQNGKKLFSEIAKETAAIQILKKKIPGKMKGIYPFITPDSY